MGKNKTNTFKKINYHLKSKQIDEKLELLNEIPTNNTTGIYVVEPEYQVQDPDVPGEVTREANFTQDALVNGRDTTGLFDVDGTTILTIEPPDALGDKSFILGPMASMWYAWGNFSTIGYIRQSDRRMVDLGRITGTLGSWNGTSGFTSYGQLLLNQAVWFRDTPKLNGADNNTPNYRSFYPGPPSNSPDQYGRYLCVITGTPKSTTTTSPPRRVPPVVGGFDPNLPPGSAKPGRKKSNNKKNSPKSSTPKPSLSNMSAKDFSAYKNGGGDAALKSGKTVQQIIDQGKKNIGQYDSTPKSYIDSLPPGVRNDFLKGGKTQSPLGDLAIMGATAAIVKTALAAGIANLGLVGLGKLSTAVTAVSLANVSKSIFSDKADNASQYNQQLAGKLVASILSGIPQEIKLSFSAKADQIKNINLTQFGNALQIGSTPPNPSAQTTVNPNNKLPVLTGDWGRQGGSEVYYNPKTDTLVIKSEKMLRTQSGDTKDPSGKITQFADIPSPTPREVEKITRDLLGSPPVETVGQGLAVGFNAVTSGAASWDQLKNDKGFISNVASTANNLATSAVQGTASNVVALRQALVNLGVPQSGVENTGGGYGQVYSQTSYSGKEIPQNLRNIINNKVGVKESLILENRIKILREIKKPYVLPEQPKVKYTFKPKVNRTINPDLMKKAEVPTSFKPMEEKLWGKYEKDQNTRWSQERKNEVLDHLGGSDHAWEYVTETSRKKNNDIMYGKFGDSKKKIVRKEELKGDTLLFIVDENGKKESILQSELSIEIANEYNKELFSNYFQEQETLQADKDPLFKRVANKIKPVIDYPDKPSSEGYPNTPPPEMVNGWHPEYGQRDSMYNKMDPQSAEVMQRVKKLDKVRKVVKKNPEGD